MNPIKANLSMCEESAAIGIQIQMVLLILLILNIKNITRFSRFIKESVKCKWWYLLGGCGWLSGILYALSCF